MRQAIEAEQAAAARADEEKRQRAEADAQRALARQAAEKAKAEAARRAYEEQRAAEEAARAAAEEAARAATVATPPPAPARLKDASAVLANRLPGVTVRTTRPVANRDVYKALWTAHRARAVAEGDLVLAVTADVLMDAAGRVPEGALHTARIERGGEAWAAWVDTAAGVVLGLASPPDVYMAGL
jgi:hypothetical protein